MLFSNQLIKQLKKADLIYVSDQRPGIMRQKIGENFKYYDSDGKKVTDSDALKRIKTLVIPPAWENVWVCSSPKGHLQATGYDEKGRKQYVYHEDWTKMCQENKFERMVFFGEVLPKIRRGIKRDMDLPGLPKKKVVATIIWLLEKTFIRIGNDEYAKENNSFGLTTLRNKHVKVRGDKISLVFVGKSGVKHEVDFSNPRVAKIIKKCIELSGYELFQYIDEDGEKQVVDSADVNDYLKKVTGEEITAKDFRTWGGTLFACTLFCKIGYSKDKKELEKNINVVVKATARHLRNTPAVCRSYYIHPNVLKNYEQKSLIRYFGKKKDDRAVLELLSAS